MNLHTDQIHHPDRVHTQTLCFVAQ